MKKSFAMLVLLLLSLALATPVHANTMSKPLVVELMAGQSKSAGTVKVWDHGNSLYVQYETIDPWCLTETHLAVATSLEEIAQRNGNPTPGQFPFKHTHNCVGGFQYTVPVDVNSCTLYIAAHAVVKKPGSNETAWGSGSAFPGKNWATYFTYETNKCTGTPSPTETPTGTSIPSPTATSTPTSAPTPIETGTPIPTIIAPPTISDIVPDAGPASGGTVVIITGTNLTGTTNVSFGDTSTTSPCVVDSDTQIRCTTPPDTSGIVDVTVTTPGGSIKLPDGFTYAPQSLPDGWEGSLVVESNQNILTVGRPYFGTQIASYDGYSTGSAKIYLPMLFRQAFGGAYNSEFYIQNTDSTHAANFSIEFFDINGILSCTLNDTLAKFSSKSYSVTELGCLPVGWVGGAVVTSDYNLVAVGHPMIGTQQMTYNSFLNGSTTIYAPMLFNQAFGGSYISALYIQNLDSTHSATFSLKFYDTSGNLTCTMTNEQRAPLAAKGFWLPTDTCLPYGWAGGVLIESDYPLAAVARSHVGAEITSYSGIIQVAHSTYVPMLFKHAFDGSYLTALYIQNVDPNNTAQITIDYYSSSGALTCTMIATLLPGAAKGYWLAIEGCMPDGWAGSAVITSNTNIVAVARPHIGTEVTTYPGLASGGHTAYLPMLFKNGGLNNDYNSALYVQNLEASPADVSIKLFDTAGNLSCVINETFAATSVKGYWLQTLATCP